MAASTMTEPGLQTLLDQLRAVPRRAWRERRLALLVAWLVAGAAALALPWVPQRFESTARVYVDTQSVLKPLMAGLAFQPDTEQQLRMLARTVVSRPNLERLMARPEVGLASGTVDEREATLTRLMMAIKLEPTQAGLYLISYRDTEPERAQRVVQAVVELFVDSSSGDKMRDSADASRFIAEQIRVYEAKLVDAESRLKEFKVRNFGVSGVSNQDYFGRMSSLSDELNKLRADLRAAEQARDAYRRDLAGEAPQLPRQFGAQPGMPALTDAEVQAAALLKTLDDLLRRYTDEHPDVVATRQQIARLEAMAKNQETSSARGGKPFAIAATSPVYQRIRIALADAEAQVASLRSRVAVEQQRLDDVRSVAGRVPQVEAELAQLNRDYEVIRKNYEQLVSRREAASLGVKLDESSRMADFRLVEPPRVNDKPVFPGHGALAAGAIVASLLLGLLAPTLLDVLRPTFETTIALRELTGRPVAGTVSLAASPAQQRGLRAATMGSVVALVLLLGCQTTWVAWVALASHG